MNTSQRFRELHTRPGIFIIPNPYDAGTARLLPQLGFEALATTSAGFAFSHGRKDGGVTREEALQGAKDILASTHLPVSADLENGFGDTPDSCAETIQLAANLGLAGGSIEDYTGVSGQPIYDFALAVDRVQAAAEAAHPSGFVLMARAENFLRGRPDLRDTIKRLQAYAEAGADVLYAPVLPDLASIKELCRSVNRPVNVLATAALAHLTLDQLAAVGVKRVSVGSALSRVAISALVEAAKASRQGHFGWLTDGLSMAEISNYMAG
ncbi:MAG: isocitrate lyase/phosphoenolpyruvate mutase family protein [Verrucomicrobia bacterium]|nr:isocitrate lyase/phosphoenolpyruvate mutase family protein [Verrucomicrobiota bacterium]